MSDREPEPSTKQLKAIQAARETSEHEALKESGTEGEARQHERRADKAAYLRDKLAERERSEREAAENDSGKTG